MVSGLIPTGKRMHLMRISSNSARKGFGGEGLVAMVSDWTRISDNDVASFGKHTCRFETAEG